MKRPIWFYLCVGSIMMVALVSLVVARDLRTSSSLKFKRSYTLSITDEHPHPFALTSVVLSFSTAQNDTFEIWMMRGSNRNHRVFSHTGSFRTVTWLLESPLVLTAGDTLLFTNSVNAQADLIYNYEL